MPLGYLAIVFKVCFNVKRCKNESTCIEKYLRQETEARNLGLYLVEGWFILDLTDALNVSKT